MASSAAGLGSDLVTLGLAWLVVLAGAAAAGVAASSTAMAMIRIWYSPFSKRRLSSRERAVQLGPLVHPVLEKLGPDAHRARADLSLDEENGESGPDRDHRTDEQQGDRCREMEPR